MKNFPMFVKVAGRRVVIVGGGEQAAQKTRLILKTEAQIEVVADDLDPELADLARNGRIAHHAPSIAVDFFADTALVFVATGCPGADAGWHGVAKAAGAAVNVVDRPDLCDLITPSIVDRDPVVVAIGTEGTAPVLARQIKSRVEELLEPKLGDLAALGGTLRAEVAQRVAPARRRDFWRWVFNGTPRLTHARGAEREAARQIKQAIAEGTAPDATAGLISLVGAGPGAKDMITLRAVQRLQEADVIYASNGVGGEILDLARRDAERVHLGGRGDAAGWPRAKILARMIAAVEQGRRVVSLHAGDPAADPDALAEARHLASRGVDVEIVPGVAAEAPQYGLLTRSETG